MKDKLIMVTYHDGSKSPDNLFYKSIKNHISQKDVNIFLKNGCKLHVFYRLYTHDLY